jgi:hypothetical protein
MAGWDALYCAVTLSTTGQWTISLTGCDTLAGTYLDMVGQSMTFSASGIYTFTGLPDFVKIVATEDSGSAACTVQTMPVVSTGSATGSEINLDTSGHIQVDVASTTGTANVAVVSSATTLPAETVVAGASSVLGKIGTIPATTGYIFAACNASGANYSRVDWRYKSDNAHTRQMYRARSNVLSGTLTFADADPVENGDTFVLNGLTFTAVTSGAVAASHEYNMGADNAAAAAACAALLITANGVPGLTAATVTTPAGTDVITLTSGTNTVLQFSQGTSGAAEIAWADTTLASLIEHGSATTAVAAITTTSGKHYEQYVDGWPWLFYGLTNTDGDAATVVVGATLYL